MPALPAESDFTGTTRTNAEMKATHGALRQYLAGLLGDDGTVPTALAALGVTGAAGQVTRTSATTLGVADRGKVVSATAGSWALTLPTAAVAGAGWLAILRNTGAGIVTVTRAAADLIDGAASVPLLPGASAMVVCTGSAWTWLALGGIPTASATDATPGRLMRVGDSATLMAASPALRVAVGGSANARTLTSGAGFAAIPAGLALRFLAPAANTGSATINLDGLGAQPCVTITGAPLPAGYIRPDTDTLAIWTGSAWMLDRQIERGSNANGEYTRWADGTQTCTRIADLDGVSLATAMGTLWRSENLASLSFPVSFANAASVHHVEATLRASDNTTIRGSALGVRLRRAQTTKSLAWDGIAIVGAASATGTAGEITRLSLAAIGRWY